jgi:phosphate/sulfate permease
MWTRRLRGNFLSTYRGPVGRALCPRHESRGYILCKVFVPITLFLATYFGIPVSTTPTITGAIVGVGAARKTAAVRWNVASDVVLAWIMTLPAAGLFGAAFYDLYKLLS